MAKIIGNPTVTPMAVPDWNQTDPTKADYIKNKPDLNKKADKTILLSKTKKIDNEAIVTDTIPVGSEIVVKVTGLPKLQQEGDAHYVEYGFREDRNEPFLAVGLTPDDKGNATISLPVTSDLVPDADVADVFWIAVCTEYSGIAELTEPLIVEYTCLEDISTSVARHETKINDMSDGLVKGFGVPFDVTGTSFVSIDKVHPKEHDVEILTDAESVTVCGKNLFNIDDGLAKATTQNAYQSLSKNADGTYTMTKLKNSSGGSDIRSSDFISVDIPNDTKITISVVFVESTAGDIVILFSDESGKTQQARCYVANGKYKTTITTTSHMKSARILCLAESTVGQYTTFKNLQVVYGSDVPEWEAFKGGTYPVTDGKAIVKSVSPLMNITTPESGVSIEAKGYQDGLMVINEIKQAIISLGGNI